MLCSDLEGLAVPSFGLEAKLTPDNECCVSDLDAKSRVSSPNSVSLTQESSQQQYVLPINASASKNEYERELIGQGLIKSCSTSHFTTQESSETLQKGYKEQAAEVANRRLIAAGHVIGTAWTVFKIRKAMES